MSTCVAIGANYNPDSISLSIGTSNFQGETNVIVGNGNTGYGNNNVIVGNKHNVNGNNNTVISSAPQVVYGNDMVVIDIKDAGEAPITTSKIRNALYKLITGIRYNPEDLRRHRQVHRRAQQGGVERGGAEEGGEGGDSGSAQGVGGDLAAAAGVVIG